MSVIIIFIFFCDEEARAWIIRSLLEKDGLFKLGHKDIDTICKLTEGGTLPGYESFFFYLSSIYLNLSLVSSFHFQGTQDQI